MSDLEFLQSVFPGVNIPKPIIGTYKIGEVFVELDRGNVPLGYEKPWHTLPIKNVVLYVVNPRNGGAIRKKVKAAPKSIITACNKLIALKAALTDEVNKQRVPYSRQHVKDAINRMAHTLHGK